MTGNLQMGGNAITGVGNIDGVDISSHAIRHNPGGLDTLATAVPVAVLVGESPSLGSNSSFAISDHQHGINADGYPVNINTTNQKGTASSVARSDHIHAHGDQTVGTLHAAVTDSINGFMSYTDKVKIDTISYNAAPLTSTAPLNVTKDTADVGIDGYAARSDHKHDISTAVAVSLTPGDSNAEGNATTLARSNHTHALPAFGTTVGTFCEGNDIRLSNTRTADSIKTLTTSVSVSGATAPSSGQALVATSSTAASWLTIVPATRNINTSNGLSGGGALSSDLTLSPTYGTTANTICQGNDSRLSDDRTASGLRSASTIISVSAATAPTTGQVLTATSGTIANWQSAAPPATIVESSSPITTSSGSDILMTSMTLTPAAGNYAVWFSGELSHNTSSATINTNIYVGGVLVTSSDRLWQRGAGQGNVTTSFCCMAKVTVNGSQAIEGRWRTSAATASCTHKQLMIIKVI